MLTKLLISSLVILCALALIILGLVYSQTSRDRTGETTFDFTGQVTGGSGENAALLQTYHADGVPLGFRRYDSGADDAPLFVLIHGSGWHGLAYDPLARRIAEAGLADVLVPDLRGHGPAPERRGDIEYIGQFEDDLHVLFKGEQRTDQPLVMGGHSSGGGLVVRYAGGPHGADLDGAILLAPFLAHDAPSTRPDSGGWAEAKVRRIIGLSILNEFGVTALNHLPVIDFAFPQEVIDGPLGHTATRSYSYRLNTSFAPRRDYLGDIAKLPSYLLVVGSEDEAFFADRYERVMSAVNAEGRYETLEGVNHLDVMNAEGAFDAIAEYLRQLR